MTYTGKLTLHPGNANKEICQLKDIALCATKL